jgi:alkaline phosphatase D
MFATGDTFAHEVASGDPLSDRVVIWTRVSAGRGPQEVGWYVAHDPDLSEVVASGLASTDGDHDHTVKVDVGGLSPGTTYFYGFTCDGATVPQQAHEDAPAV